MFLPDFANSGIRLICLDDQQWTDTQGAWFDSVLEDAKANGLAVVTASHMLSGAFTTPINSTFNPVDDYTGIGYAGTNIFENHLVTFKANGGIHICHLCGHNHFDNIGYTANDILNIQADCGTPFQTGKVETWRYPNSTITRAFDSFNVVTIDVNTKRIKIVRIGNNTNASLLGKNVLCYDYENKKVIANY